MILYDMKDDGKDDTYDMKETEAPLHHRFDPHGSHPGGGRIGCRVWWSGRFVHPQSPIDWPSRYGEKFFRGEPYSIV